MQHKRQQNQQNSQPIKRQFTGPPRAQGQQKPQGQEKKPGQQKTPQFGVAPKSDEKPLCKECNRTHYGKCMWVSFKCFICKVEGHKAIDGPKKKGQTIGRAYVMRQRQSQTRL